MNEKLMDFLKRHMERGSDMAKVKQDLLNAGHDIVSVEEHLSHVLREKKAKDFVRKHVKIGSDIEKIKQVLLNAGIDIRIAEEYINNELKNRKKRKNALVAIIAAISLVILISGIAYFVDFDKKTASISEGTDAKHQKNIEIFNEALISNDTSLCIQIDDEKLKEECKRKFEYSIFNETDENFEDKEQLNKALINRNISLCAEINDYGIKIKCEQILKL